MHDRVFFVSFFFFFFFFINTKPEILPTLQVTAFSWYRFSKRGVKVNLFEIGMNVLRLNVLSLLPNSFQNPKHCDLYLSTGNPPYRIVFHLVYTK